MPGGRQERLPGTLSRGFRARWTAGKATWNAFAGKPCQVGSGKRHLTRFCRDSVPSGQREETPGTLLRGFRARWAAGRCHLEHFCGKTVAGGRRERRPGTLLRENRGRWEAGRCHLTRFCGKTVAGGQREGTPGILLRENRSRWAAGKDTWNAFAGIPCQVGSKRCYLTRFCGDTLLLCQMENFIGI